LFRIVISAAVLEYSIYAAKLSDDQRPGGDIFVDLLSKELRKVCAPPSALSTRNPAALRNALRAATNDLVNAVVTAGLLGSLQ